MIDTKPMPDHIPKVQEIGTSSAPLLSASFFIGARCQPFNDDYMHCKNEANGRGELDCMREGRKVTRCAASVYVALLPLVLAAQQLHEALMTSANEELTFINPHRIKDVNTHCLAQFRDHWHCLENNNHQLYQCRRWERKLNKCVFDNLVQIPSCSSPVLIVRLLITFSYQGLEKTLPGAPPGDVPVHLREKQIYATLPQDDPENRWHRRVLERMWGLEAKKKEREEAKRLADRAVGEPVSGQAAEST